MRDDPDVITATHTNRATIDYVAATINQPFSYVTNETVTPIVRARGPGADEDREPRTRSLLGQNLTSTLVVTNNGPNTSLGVTLTDTIPTPRPRSFRRRRRHGT